MARSNRIKINSVWYWYSYKLSWGHKYYSMDGGDTWHRKKSEAFEYARKAGSLLLSS